MISAQSRTCVRPGSGGLRFQGRSRRRTVGGEGDEGLGGLAHVLDERLEPECGRDLPPVQRSGLTAGWAARQQTPTSGLPAQTNEMN
jgi:hypothetical protein